jgi:hypothetical protein
LAPEFINEVAPKIASAVKETLDAAAKEADPAKKKQLLADAEKLKTEYYALHGVGR